ncbi:MAG TPA: hypothetical protein VGD54_07565 [Steroidobacteraceae bacterium]
MNPTARGRIVEMSKAMPTTEDERTTEAKELVSMIAEVDFPKLTTWERATVEEIKEGKAASKFRLREVRGIVKRLQQGE